jgi:hypothetical protein
MQEAEQPRLIGRYQVVKLLGRGVQGAVFLASIRNCSAWWR